MSDFCLVEEACHDRFAIGEGARGVVSVCKIVNVGCREMIKIEPFKYLDSRQKITISKLIIKNIQIQLRGLN